MIDRLLEHVVRWRPLRHLAYWGLLVVFFGLFWGSEEGYYGHLIGRELILLPTKMALVYGTLYVLLPRLLFRRRYLAFLAAIFLALSAAAVVLRLQAYFILRPLYGHHAGESLWNIYKLVQLAADSNTVLILPLGYSLFREWFYKQLETSQLANERTQAELQLLKHQLHPHFLFNSLNNLYSLVLQKSDAAPDVVLRLAALMRYQLYEASANTCPLPREIEYLQHYIGMERLRYPADIDLHLAIYGAPEAWQLPPLLLLPLVENAFKHGLATLGPHNWIRMELSIGPDQLSFLVENSKNTDQPPSPVSGIGLRNLRRRLQLLYPDRHQLHIENHPDTYLARLTLHAAHA